MILKRVEIGLIFATIVLSVLANFNSDIAIKGQSKETAMNDSMGKMESNENNNVPNGFSPNPHPNASQPANTTIQNLSFSRLKQEGSPVSGNPSAPITVIQFGDFQCRFCGRFARETEPQVNQTYVQTGKINLAFKHFVTHGPDSMTAAIASQCANEQGTFWSFYKILYSNQGDENSGWASAANLKKFATRISGVDAHEFNSCLDNQKYKSLVDNDTAFAYKSGFQGTPTFIIENNNGSNPQVLLGAYPFPALQAILDKRISGG